MKILECESILNGVKMKWTEKWGQPPKIRPWPACIAYTLVALSGPVVSRPTELSP